MLEFLVMYDPTYDLLPTRRTWTQWTLQPKQIFEWECGFALFQNKIDIKEDKKGELTNQKTRNYVTSGSRSTTIKYQILV